tara:strand:- start:5486 stop:6700 length:1215 start_codon:yes stop_codon:yes gene_type:complete
MQKKFSVFKITFLSIFLPFWAFSNSLNLSEDIESTEISILTCDPGTQIYSLFGHSALRIKNPKNSHDLVINWGLFEFSESQFQFGYDFAKGRLKYFMGIQSMSNFMVEYRKAKRGVREQVLNLNNQEKYQIIQLLKENYKAENRKYRYEFFYANCSSRLRDVVKRVFKENIEFYQSPKSNKFTFRETIHQYLESFPWLKLGIDLVLGQKIDVLVNNENLMFLPLNVEQIFDQSFIQSKEGEKNLIKSKNTLVQSYDNKNKPNNIGIYSWLLLAITLFLIVFKFDKAIGVWSSLNLFIIGLLGVFLVFMWIGTDHNATKMNFNLLWGSPFHFILIYCLVKESWTSFTYWYLILSLILIFTTILFWFTLTQEFNSFVKPIILQLVIIYYYYFKKCSFQINLNQTNG